MKINKVATSIIEVMIVLLILSAASIGMFSMYTASVKFSDTTKNKIQAIQIAREGLEAVRNIRDTNVLLFPLNTNECWNVLDYNAGCLGGSSSKISNKSYTLSRNSRNRWILKPQITGLFKDATYQMNYQVTIDSDGFYIQASGLGSSTPTIPFFTRELQISYTNPDEMKVIAIVQWKDLSYNDIHKVEISSTLTNWKK